MFNKKDLSNKKHPQASKIYKKSEAQSKVKKLKKTQKKIPNKKTKKI